MENKNIRELIDQKLIESGNQIPDTVAQALADKEIGERVNLATTGFLRQEELSKELEKLDRPDITTHVQDGNGQLVPQKAYSNQHLEKIKKAKERYKNLSDALENALGDTSAEKYKKLKEAIEKSKEGDKQNQGGNNQ